MQPIDLCLFPTETFFESHNQRKMASTQIPVESCPPPASILSKGGTGKNVKNWGVKTAEAVRFAHYVSDSQAQRK